MQNETKKIFVTGPDGLLGSNIVRELLSQGYEVRAMVEPGRKPGTLEGLPIEIVEGDLLNPEQVRSLMQGARYVVHVAASTMMWPDDNPIQRKVNIEGTRHVLDACVANHIERLVFIGSANSFGPGDKQNPGDESRPYTGHVFHNDYLDSKYRAHQLVLEYVKNGLNAVMVNPTFMLGPYDSKPSSGAMIVAVYKGTVPGYSPGGKNYICVRDAAKGVVNAITKGRTGESYILGNENLDFNEAFTKMASVMGVKPPSLRIPSLFILIYGLWGSFIARLTGKPPAISYTMAKISISEFYYDSSKAVRELELPQTPIEQGIQEAFEWFKNNGYL
ncbi:MAG: SDR family oxidoreductase [Saprospiraceae bacterium]|nr:SDR family oxidoreductase [Saprospiraceae bacterium]